MVIGAVERKGKVKTKVIPATNIKHATEAITEFVAPGSIMVTDTHDAYNKVKHLYEHHRVNHSNGEYVRRESILVHTNSIEGYWNILKKQINGIHHSVSAKHLQRYCDESAFRFNNRTALQDERFASALTHCEGTLQYKVLIAE